MHHQDNKKHLEHLPKAPTSTPQKVCTLCLEEWSDIQSDLLQEVVNGDKRHVFQMQLPTDNYQIIYGGVVYLCCCHVVDVQVSYKFPKATKQNARIVFLSRTKPQFTCRNVNLSRVNLLVTI